MRWVAGVSAAMAPVCLLVCIWVIPSKAPNATAGRWFATAVLLGVVAVVASLIDASLIDEGQQ